MTNSDVEIFDVIDENDQVIGQATRDECHDNPDLLHHTVGFTLFDRKTNKIFLRQRSFAKKRDAGKICFPGEHVLAGESYEAALKRGCLEELGFEPSEFKEVAHTIFRNTNESELVRFFVIYWNGEEITFDKSELENVFWVSREELESNAYDTSDMTKYWLEKAKLAQLLV